MSKRNSLDQKSERRYARIAEKLNDSSRRIPVSTVPRSALTAALSGPTNKLTGRIRRRLMRGRDAVVVMDTKTPTTPEAYFSRKFRELSWQRLNRASGRVSCRQRKVSQLLVSLSPGSPFRQPLNHEFSILSVKQSVIQHEIKRRNELVTC